MQLWEAGAIFAASSAAGAINAAVGSGTLITFSTLVALGYSPLVANVSNNLGLISGSIAGSWGYRRELRGWAPVLYRLLPWSVAGGVLGAVLLLVLPPGAFVTIVPVLIALAVVLVVLQPWLAARVASRAGQPDQEATPAGTQPTRVGPLLAILTLVCGVYGGYFGAAQGVLMLGVLGWLFTSSLQVANGLKNVLTAAVNAVAAVMFVVLARDEIDWIVVALMSVGATLGGLTGAALGRRMPAPVLRGLIVTVGIIAIIRLRMG
jgi:uncharacterized protein